MAKEFEFVELTASKPKDIEAQDEFFKKKEENFIRIFEEYITVKYVSAKGLLNIRGFVGSFYNKRMSSHPLFFLSEGAFNIFISDVKNNTHLDNITIVCKEIKISQGVKYYVVYYSYTKLYPRGFTLEHKKIFFFKKEKYRDYSLRGYLSNKDGDYCFVPINIPLNALEEICNEFQMPDINFDTDVFFSAPVYIR